VTLVATITAAPAAPTSTVTTLVRHPTPTTATPGALITVNGGPNATANIPGPHNDSADFYGIFVALAIIVVAIAITRVVFGWRGGSRRGGASRERRRGGSGPEITPDAIAADPGDPAAPPPQGEARTPGSA
jgi:hypothetical protein